MVLIGLPLNDIVFVRAANSFQWPVEYGISFKTAATIRMLSRLGSTIGRKAAAPFSFDVDFHGAFL